MVIRVSRGHFHRSHAVGQSAHSQGAHVNVRRIQLEAQVVRHKLEGPGIGQLLQRPDGDGVQGVDHAVAHRAVAGVAAGGVGAHGGVPGVAVGAEGGVDGIVVNDAAGRNHVILDGRGVDAHRLDGAPRLAAGDGQIQLPVHGLLSYAAGYGDHVSIVVHDRYGGGDGRTALGSVLLKVRNILVDRVHLGLDLRVEGGFDVVALAVEHLGGVLAAVALVLHQQVDGLVDGRVLEPSVEFGRVRDLLSALLVGLGDVQAVDGLVLVGVGEAQLLRLGGLVFRLGDLPLIPHFLQDDLLAALVEIPGCLDRAVVLLELRAAEGIVEGGVVGDADNAGTLRQVQLGNVLAEVGLGGGLDAGAARAEVDPVEVLGDDVLLAGVLLILQRPEDLPELPLDGDVRVLVFVAQQLLGDSGAAPGGAAGNGGLDGAGRADPVHAGVLPEPLVLNGHQGVHQVLGQVLVLDKLPVAAARLLAVVVEGQHGRAVFVVHSGGQGQLHFLRGGDAQGGAQCGVHVGQEDFGEYACGQYADDAQGEYGQKEPSDDLADDAAHGVLLFLAPGVLLPAVGGAAVRTAAIGLIHSRMYLLFQV